MTLQTVHRSKEYLEFRKAQAKKAFDNLPLEKRKKILTNKLNYSKK